MDMSASLSDSSVRPSSQEKRARADLNALFANSPIPEDAILDHLEVFLRPQRIGEIVAISELYRKVLPVHGAIMEFGVRWGRHMSLFCSLRAVFEPTNFYRPIVGFDSFEGLRGSGPFDGESDRVRDGSMAVSPGYENFLADVLRLNEQEAPLAHIRRWELCKGDASEQLKLYLDRHPETIVAFAYFDMDLYQPTRDCLELLLPVMPRGAVLAFDEAMHPEFPGESVALKELVDLSRHKLERFPTCPNPAFVVL